MEKRLTAKQIRFIEEYLISGNATAAAIRAGYSEKTAAEMAYENLRKPHVEAEIAKRRADLAENAVINAADVVSRLYKIATADITSVISIDDDGKYKVKPTSEWGESERAAVKKISINKAGIPVVEFYDRDRVLADLADKLGLWDKCRGDDTSEGISVSFEGEDISEYAQ